tara:strand:+ start:3089 stop:4120 length:1032 start_codon:yes stop_codon:yes gene_type:complete
MDNIKINNNVLLEDLHDNMMWIHGNSKENILITIFLITIEGEQLKYSLDAINKLELDNPILVNVIMNVCPTNKAYNEMRLRCKTKYFIQNDEDMELYSNAIPTMYKVLKNVDSKKVFLNAFKLIDTVIGIGNPPIIDCLKLYNNEIMQKYPTFKNGDEDVSSVDSLWHKPIKKDNYKIKNTNIIIGYHGKHRTNFDLLLRYCKIIKSLIDPRIKTNSGHLCKIIKAISNGIGEPEEYLDFIISIFTNYNNIDISKLNTLFERINGYVSDEYLNMYKIKERYFIGKYDKIINKLELSENFKIENSEKFYCFVAILCIVTNNYGYSKNKYPYKYYDFFEKNIKSF